MKLIISTLLIASATSAFAQPRGESITLPQGTSVVVSCENYEGGGYQGNFRGRTANFFSGSACKNYVNSARISGVLSIDSQECLAVSKKTTSVVNSFHINGVCTETSWNRTSGYQSCLQAAEKANQSLRQQR